MYEFSYPKIAYLSASEIHDNILYLEASLKKNLEQSKSSYSKESIDLFTNLINYVKSSINVVIDINNLKNEEIDFDLIQNLINNSNQLNLPLNIFVMGGSNFNQAQEKSDMLFSNELLDKFTMLNDLLVKSGKSPLRFMEDPSMPESSWTLDEVKKANSQIDIVVNFIKENKLSPFESMAFIHKVITSTFSYNDDEMTPINSRSIVGVVKTSKIVCVGYSRFIKAIIDKLEMKGLECETFLSTLNSYDLDNAVLDELGISPYGTIHMQDLIKIKDPKYNVDGVYVSDACWDAKNEFFPAGKGYGSFMFPVTDLVSYKGIAFDQPKSDFEALIGICNINEQVDPESFPIIKENISKSKPIKIEQLTSCLKNLFKVLYPNDNQEKINLRVKRTLDVSKAVANSIFTNNAKNALAIESYKDAKGLE